MTVPRLYDLARKVSLNLYIRGYEREDLIQECVTEALEILSFTHEPPACFVAQAMRFHLFNIMRKKEPLYSAEEFIDVIHVPSFAQVQIPIPMSNSSARHIVIALLENDFHLQKAASSLGISYRTARRNWVSARRIIAQDKEVVSMFSDATYSLIRREYYGDFGGSGDFRDSLSIGQRSMK